MKSILLQPDDLQVGQLVTVHTGPQRETAYTERTAEDRTFCGLPMKLLAINLPYVALAMLSGPGRVVLDVRELSLMEISSEFAAALAPGGQPAASQPQQNSWYPKSMAELVECIEAVCDCPSCSAKRSNKGKQ